jgi:Icc-related predicted phosphoesterase
MRFVFITLRHVNHIEHENRSRMHAGAESHDRTTVRILAFTDFHGDNEAFERAKQLIRGDKWNCVAVAGDITNYDLELAKRRLKELAEPGVPIFFVPGNMDSPELSSWSGRDLVRPLHGRSAKLGAVTLIGLGGSPPGPFSTPFEVPEERAAELMNQALTGLEKGTLVLVSHCPPKNTKLDVVPSGEHAGSMAVRRFVEKIQPALVISGHVHEARGIDAIGGTTLVNTGPASRGLYAGISLENKVLVRLGIF